MTLREEVICPSDMELHVLLDIFLGCCETKSGALREHEVLLNCDEIYSNIKLAFKRIQYSFFLFFSFFETGFLCGFGGCRGNTSCRPGWS